MPAGSTSHSAAQLTLPDVITELDLLLPDPTLDLGDLGRLPFDSNAHISHREAITLSDDFLLDNTMELGLGSNIQEDGDLGDLIDLDLDIGEPEDTTPRPGRLARQARSPGLQMESDGFEMGRDAPAERDIGEDLMDSRMEDVFSDAPKGPGSEVGRLEEDLQLVFDDEDTGVAFHGDLGLGGEEDQEGDLTILGASTEVERRSPGPTPLIGPETPRAPSVRIARSERAESSPLSSVRSSVDRELEGDPRTHGDLLNLSYLDDTLRPLTEEPEPEHAVQQQRAVRGRRVMVDEVTEIRAKQIKAQQEDRSKILKEPSFLPRDPTLLALLSLQKSRGFAQNVFYPKNIAPELASLLSPEFVRRMAELKRKREDEDEEVVAQEARSPSKQPRLEFDEEEQFLPMEDETKEDHAGSGDEGGDEMFMLPHEDEQVRVGEETEEEMMLPADINGEIFVSPKMHTFNCRNSRN